ncbi:hypothetical protein [Nocardia sp. BMG51109]|uniref:hypothetical protein n=1 Tax=Nocardia sp. BMG51109 TaxID=1056816 RepID=UPI000463C079|nr:hypothetical protein [Nocardia sp. BMG51109]
MTDAQGGPDRPDQGSDAGSADAPAAPPRSGLTEGTVEAGWLRPHTRRSLGRPRVSTIVLILLWVGVLVLYLQVHP